MEKFQTASTNETDDRMVCSHAVQMCQSSSQSGSFDQKATSLFDNANRILIILFGRHLGSGFKPAGSGN